MRSTEQTEILIGAKLICIALGLYEGGKLYFREPWIACFIPHELSVLSPWFLFLVKRDFGNSRELWFLIRIICETRIGCLIQCELWFSFMLFLIFREKKLKIQLFRLKQISSLNQWRLLWWQWFFIRRKWCWGSTSKHTTQFPFHSTKNKKLENGEDIGQGSSLAVVLNQSKKNWSYKNLFSRETRNVEFIVREMWNGHFIFYTWSPPLLPSYMITRTWLINAGSMLLLRNEAGIQEIAGRNPKASRTILFLPLAFLNTEIFLGNN